MWFAAVSPIFMTLFTGCDCDDCHDGKAEKMMQGSKEIHAAYVRKTHAYYPVAQLEATCFADEKKVTVSSTIAVRDYVTTSNLYTVTINDTANVYETIGYAIPKVITRKMDDYYLHQDCVKELNRNCFAKSACMIGKPARADCHVLCPIFDLYSSSRDPQGGGVEFSYRIYGVTIPRK